MWVYVRACARARLFVRMRAYVCVRARARLFVRMRACVRALCLVEDFDARLHLHVLQYEVHLVCRCTTHSAPMEYLHPAITVSADLDITVAIDLAVCLLIAHVSIYV